MLSFLIDTDVFLYGYIQLIHMYKQLYTTKNKTLAGGGYTIMFYTIQFHMFVCGLYLLYAILFYCIVLSYVHMTTYSYVVYMNVCSCVHI